MDDVLCVVVNLHVQLGASMGGRRLVHAVVLMYTLRLRHHIHLDLSRPVSHTPVS